MRKALDRARFSTLNAMKRLLIAVGSTARGVGATSHDGFSTPEGLHKSALFRKHCCLSGNVTATSGARRFFKQEQGDAAQPPVDLCGRGGAHRIDPQGCEPS